MPPPNPLRLTDDQQAVVRGICDAYERDRQTLTAATLETYLERAPKKLKSHVLEELLSIEIRLLQRSGEAPVKDSILADSGVPAAEFEAVWQRVANQQTPHSADTAVDTCAEGASLLTQAPTAADANETIDLTDANRSGRQSMAETIGFGEGHVGGIIAGDYELLGELGHGGMGVVFQAYQHSLRRQVALKIIPRRLLNSPQVVSRFYVEAEAAAAMNHADIVRVHDVGEADGVHYYAMDLVDGFSLSKYVGKGDEGPEERLPQREAVQIIERIARAVQYAHDLSVIHRDIKPENILLDKQGQPHLTDFGLAKFLQEGDALTMTGEVLGTPAYMAPEQASGSSRDVSARTDVYGLGATLFGLLSGRRPYMGSAYDVMRQVVHAGKPSLLEIAAQTPLDLHTICSKCLEKSPLDRYASAGELADDLRRFLDGYPIMARPLSPFHRAVRWCRRNPTLAGLIAAVWVALLVGSVVSTYFGIQARASAIKASASAAEATDRVTQMKGLLAETLEIVTSRPAIQAHDRQLLSIARDHYQDLIDQYQHDSSLRREYADAQFFLGRIESALSHSDEEDIRAREAFTASLASQRAILAENANDVRALGSLGSIHQELSKLEQLHWRKQQVSSGPAESDRQALANWISQAQEATRFRRRVLAITPQDPEAHRLVASSLESVALAMNEGGVAIGELASVSEGIAKLNEAQQLRQQALSKFTESQKLQLDLARGFYNLAVTHQDLARLREAKGNASAAAEAHGKTEQLARTAIEKFEQSEQDVIADVEARFEFANCYRIRADALQKRGQHEDAALAYESAIRELRWVVSRNPLVYKYRKELALAQFNLCNLRFVMRDVPGGLAALAACQATLIEELRAAPSNTDAAAQFVELTLSLAAGFQGATNSQLKIIEAATDDLRSLWQESEEYGWLAEQVEELQRKAEELKSQLQDRAV